MSAYAESDFDSGLRKFIGLLSALFAFGGYWMGRYLGASREEMFGVFIVLIVASAVGWVLGRISSHHIDGDGGLALGLALSLLVAWWLPVIGYFLAAFVGELYNVAPRWKFLHLTMAYVGCLASFANSVAGVLASHGPLPGPF